MNKSSPLLSFPTKGQSTATTSPFTSSSTNSYSARSLPPHIEQYILQTNTGSQTQSNILLASIHAHDSTYFYQSLADSRVFTADASTKDGETALHLAVRLGHSDFVHALLEHKADPSCWDYSGTTPLHYAVQNGDYAIARTLIQALKAVKWKDNSLRVLINSVSTNDKSRFKVGFAALFRYNSGRTPLGEAAARGDCGMMRILIGEGGADIDAKQDHGWTAFTSAADAGQLAAIELLRNLKADTEVKDYIGATPLMRASARGQWHVVDFLLKNQPAIGVQYWSSWAKDNKGQTPLHWCAGAGDDLAEVFERTREGNKNGNRREFSETGHDKMTWEECFENVAWNLLHYGADTDAVDNEGRSALWYAKGSWVLHRGRVRQVLQSRSDEMDLS